VYAAPWASCDSSLWRHDLLQDRNQMAERRAGRRSIRHVKRGKQRHTSRTNDSLNAYPTNQGSATLFHLTRHEVARGSIHQLDRQTALRNGATLSSSQTPHGAQFITLFAFE
jgi:hypothetical protein